jgi:tripartite-type tricarboxylate transporter receptor subunit TctC
LAFTNTPSGLSRIAFDDANKPARSVPRQAGVPNSAYNSWLGLFAPAGTPAEIIDALNRETTNALKQRETVEKLAALGAEAAPMTPAAFEAFVAEDIASLAKLVKLAKIPVN